MTAAVVPIRDVSARPLSQPTATYLSFKRKRLTPASERGYQAVLREFVAYFSDRELADFEPPAGSILIEDFHANPEVETVTRGAYLHLWATFKRMTS